MHMYVVIDGCACVTLTQFWVGGTSIHDPNPFPGRASYAAQVLINSGILMAHGGRKINNIAISHLWSVETQNVTANNDELIWKEAAYGVPYARYGHSAAPMLSQAFIMYGGCISYNGMKSSDTWAPGASDTWIYDNNDQSWYLLENGNSDRNHPPGLVFSGIVSATDVTDSQPVAYWIIGGLAIDDNSATSTIPYTMHATMGVWRLTFNRRPTQSEEDEAANASASRIRWETIITIAGPVIALCLICVLVFFLRRRVGAPDEVSANNRHAILAQQAQRNNIHHDPNAFAEIVQTPKTMKNGKSCIDHSAYQSIMYLLPLVSFSPPIEIDGHRCDNSGCGERAEVMCVQCCNYFCNDCDILQHHSERTHTRMQLAVSLAALTPQAITRPPNNDVGPSSGGNGLPMSDAALAEAAATLRAMMLGGPLPSTALTITSEGSDTSGGSGGMPNNLRHIESTTMSGGSDSFVHTHTGSSNMGVMHTDNHAGSNSTVTGPVISGDSNNNTFISSIHGHTVATTTTPLTIGITTTVPRSPPLLVQHLHEQRQSLQQHQRHPHSQPLHMEPISPPQSPNRVTVRTSSNAIVRIDNGYGGISPPMSPTTRRRGRGIV
jgi:hypothetical protein